MLKTAESGGQKAEKNTSPIGEFGFPLFSFVF